MLAGYAGAVDSWPAAIRIPEGCEGTVSTGQVGPNTGTWGMFSFLFFSLFEASSLCPCVNSVFIMIFNYNACSFCNEHYYISTFIICVKYWEIETVYDSLSESV